MNSYNQAVLKGRIGSGLDFSWTGKEHTCCQSKVVWRHKKNCLQVVGNENEIGNQKWKDLDKLDKKQYINQLFELNV